MTNMDDHGGRVEAGKIADRRLPCQLYRSHTKREVLVSYWSICHLALLTSWSQQISLYVTIDQPLSAGILQEITRWYDLQQVISEKKKHCFVDFVHYAMLVLSLVRIFMHHNLAYWSDKYAVHIIIFMQGFPWTWKLFQRFLQGKKFEKGYHRWIA